MTLKVTYRVAGMQLNVTQISKDDYEIGQKLFLNAKAKQNFIAMSNKSLNSTNSGFMKYMIKEHEISLKSMAGIIRKIPSFDEIDRKQNSL